MLTRISVGMICAIRVVSFMPWNAQTAGSASAL
jgi:hypothetical protein